MGRVRRGRGRRGNAREVRYVILGNYYLAIKIPSLDFPPTTGRLHGGRAINETYQPIEKTSWKRAEKTCTFRAKVYTESVVDGIVL